MIKKNRADIFLPRLFEEKYTPSRRIAWASLSGAAFKHDVAVCEAPDPQLLPEVLRMPDP